MERLARTDSSRAPVTPSGRPPAVRTVRRASGHGGRYERSASLFLHHHSDRMKRDLDRLASGSFDLLVLGGGMLGAFVARNAARRGLETALLEKDDFAAGASGNNLKIVHGGLRHLGRLRLRSARRSSRARAAWLREAPHLVEPLPVLVPGGPEGSPSTPALHAGAWAERLVLPDRNRSVPDGRRLPSPRVVGPKRVQESAPVLEALPIDRALLFHDGLTYRTERVVIEALEDATEHGCAVANYLEAVGSLSAGSGKTRGIEARDWQTGDELSVRGRVVVNASGASAGEVARRLGISPVEPGGLALGVNLVLDPIGLDAAVALPTPASLSGTPTRGETRHLFLVPWRGRTLVGTAYRTMGSESLVSPASPQEGDSLSTAEDELAESLLDELEEALGGWKPAPGAIRHVHSALLPLGDDGSLLLEPRCSTGRMGGEVPVLTARTEKFTTAPRLARRCVDWAFRRLGYRRPPRGGEGPLPGGVDWSRDLLERATEAAPPALDRDIVEHLCRVFGTRWADVCSRRHEGETADRRVVGREPVILGQFRIGIRREMALTPDDLLARRTELEERGLAGPAARRAAVRAFEETDLRRDGGEAT